MDTLSFDRMRARAIYAKHRERLKSALRQLKRGLRFGCNRTIARAATESTELSQLSLPKWAYPELRSRAHAWGLLGINCAHSGTVLGLMYEPSTDGESLLRSRTSRAFGPQLAIVGAFRIIGGGNHAV